MANSLKIPKGYSEVVNRRRTDNTMAKSLKIPKGYSEVVNRRRTDNTMANRLKMPKGYSEVVNRRRTDNTMAKSLKIPKGQSEVVNRRRTDNTMAKRKSTKRLTMIYKKLKIEQQKKPTKTGDKLRFGREGSSCSTSGIRRVTLVKPGDKS